MGVAVSGTLEGSTKPTLELRSLRLQVYEYLKGLMNEGGLRPGSFLDLRSLERDLGISRTPLRDALLRLESEGFVEILSRRGVQIAELTLERIRDIYQIIGALEASVLRSLPLAAADALSPEMGALNEEMVEALALSDYDRFYERNAAFHDRFLRLSINGELVERVHILKQRLYDFPQHHEVILEWEQRSTREHQSVVELLAARKPGAAADFIRDVHWSFTVQSPFIRRYYGVGEGGALAAR